MSPLTSTRALPTWITIGAHPSAAPERERTTRAIGTDRVLDAEPSDRFNRLDHQYSRVAV